MKISYMKRRIQSMIDNIEWGLQINELNGSIYTKGYGFINSIAYKEAVRNKNVLKEIDKILVKCFV